MWQSQVMTTLLLSVLGTHGQMNESLTEVNLTAAASDFLACTAEDCSLPRCFCNQQDQLIGALDPQATPQMVLFSYTGTVTKATRDDVTELFPDTVVNPNGCSVGITLFVEGEGTDNCAVHRMYIRGHEIATGGLNNSYATPSWDKEAWYTHYEQHRQNLSRDAYLDKGHVRGMRSRGFLVGGDTQYAMADDNYLLYDSSLILNPAVNLSGINSNFWPFTLDVPLDVQNLSCHNFRSRCPGNSHPALWEVPASQLVDEPYKPCSLLEQCTATSTSQVFDLLKNNFEVYYNGSRAPFIVNLGPVSLSDPEIANGIKRFRDYLLQKDDTWLITMQEAIRWMERPVANDDAHALWHCRDTRMYNGKCLMLATEEMPIPPFLTIINVHKLWIWQTVILTVVYLGVLMYDQVEKKKRKLR